MDRMKDMATGSPLRLILFFALPLIVANIGQQLYQYFGEGDHTRVRKAVAASIYLSLIGAAILTVVCLALERPSPR